MTTSPGFTGLGAESAGQTLTRVARAAAGAGAVGGLCAVALLWVALAVMEPRPGGGVLVGATALGMGAALWTAAQSTFARWLAPARTGALLVTTTAAMVGSAPVAVGMVGVSGSWPLGLGLFSVMGAVVLVEARLVTRLASEPGTDQVVAYPVDGDDRRSPETAPEGTTAAALAWLASAGVAFAVGVGVPALAIAAVFMPLGELDWDVLVFAGGVGVAVVAVAWALPQLAILWWLGRLGGVARRGVAFGGLTTAVVAAGWPLLLPGTELWWVATLLFVAVALPAVELILVAALWTRRT